MGIARSRQCARERRRLTDRRGPQARRRELARWQQRTLDSTLDLWRGRFAAAADWILRESAEYADRLAADLDVPAGNFRQTRMGQAYWLLREQGRMHELFAGGLADDVQEHGYFPVWRAGLVLALCETGARDQAADLLQAFADDTDGFRALPPHGWAVPTLALLAEACAAIGDQAELRPLVARLRERLAPHNGTGIALAGWPTVLVAPTAQAVRCARPDRRGTGRRPRALPPGGHPGPHLRPAARPAPPVAGPRPARLRPPGRRRGGTAPAALGPRGRGGVRDGTAGRGVRGAAGGGRRRVRQTSRAVRRVLSPVGLAAGRATAIHLGPALPPASCGLPADSGGQPSIVRAGPSHDGPF